jgi:RNA polymerase sigma-54 factor
MNPGKLGLRQELRQVLAPEMLQLLKLLQLPTLELQQLVRQELEINPMLEEVLEEPEGEGGEQPTEQEEQVAPELNQIDWRDYLQDGIDDRCLQRLESAEEPEGPVIVQRESFQDYLLFQLRMATSDQRLLPVGEYLIGNLNDDGYLLQPLEEVAQALGQDLETVQAALELVHRLDPPGVGCRDLRECLLIQLNLLNQGQSLAAQIVSRHLSDLEHQRYPVIARSLGVLESQVLQARELISSLSPKPGAGFSSEEPQYVYPDLIIEKRDGQYLVTINDQEVPRVRLTSGYRQILSQARKSSPQDREYVAKRLEAARFIVRMIEQRRRTLIRIMESIIVRQSEFLEKGNRYIRPLTMKQIAQDIEMHESTVSRAVHNKYVITPNGMLPVRYFFGVGLKSGSGEDSAKAIKDKIAEMISQEDSRKPLSDQEVADRLGGQSIGIARRTVAKYREELKILPAKLRRRRS